MGWWAVWEIMSVSPSLLLLSLSLGLLCTHSHLQTTHTQTHCRSKLPSSMTSLSCGAPSGSEPGKDGGAGPGARMSDLIHPDNQGPFGSPVTTATPPSQHSGWLVDGASQGRCSLHPFLMASVLSRSSWACLPAVPSPRRRGSRTWWKKPPLHIYCPQS